MRKALLSKIFMPASSALTPFKSWSYMREMCAQDLEPLQNQRMERMALIRELLAHAYREVELYRTALDGAGVDPVQVSYPKRFAQVPVISKRQLREGFPLRQLARSYRRGWLRYSNTSGTTDRPLLLIQDIKDISQKYASILRSRVLAGVDPLGTQVRITPNECRPCLPDGNSPEWVSPFAHNKRSPGRRSSLFLFLERQVVNPWFHRRHFMSPFWGTNEPTRPVDFDHYLDTIDSLQPEILTLYPLYGVLLARHIQRRGLDPPKVYGVLEFSGGVCSPRMREFMSQVFDVRTAQACGGCEFARYGASCSEDPDRMHLAEGFCYVEAVSTKGSLCAPGELGNIIVTSLHSRAMPIIRLESGDVGRIVEAPCTCGRRSRRMEHCGRLQALVLNSANRWVTERDVLDELFFVPGVELFQLIQISKTRYELRIVESIDAAIDEGHLTAALKSLLGQKAKVKRVTVRHLETEESGKLQLVQSSTFEAFRPSIKRSRYRAQAN
jgi:phenylacetate-CoA ligase